MSDFKPIPVDHATGLLIEMLRDHLTQEPPQDAGGHPSPDVHDRVGAAWAEWDRHAHGLRILIGSRLASEAVRQATR